MQWNGITLFHSITFSTSIYRIFMLVDPEVHLLSYFELQESEVPCMLDNILNRDKCSFWAGVCRSCYETRELYKKIHKKLAFSSDSNQEN